MAGNVRDSVFHKKWRTWTRIGKCLSQAYSSFYAHASWRLNDSDDDDYTEEEYDAEERGAEEQQRDVKRYCQKLSKPRRVIEVCEICTGASSLNSLILCTHFFFQSILDRSS